MTPTQIAKAKHKWYTNLAVGLRELVLDGKVETYVPEFYSHQTKKVVPEHLRTQGMTSAEAWAIIHEAERYEMLASVELEQLSL
jgi:hypothetical protein